MHGAGMDASFMTCDDRAEETMRLLKKEESVITLQVAVHCRLV